MNIIKRNTSIKIIVMAFAFILTLGNVVNVGVSNAPNASADDTCSEPYTVPVEAIGDEIDWHNTLQFFAPKVVITNSDFAQYSPDLEFKNKGEIKYMTINCMMHFMFAANYHVVKRYESRTFAENPLPRIDHIQAKYRGKMSDASLYIYFADGRVWNNGDNWGTWNVPVTPPDPDPVTPDPEKPLSEKGVYENQISNFVKSKSVQTVILCGREFFITGLRDDLNGVSSGLTHANDTVSLLPSSMKFVLSSDSYNKNIESLRYSELIKGNSQKFINFLNCSDEDKNETLNDYVLSSDDVNQLPPVMQLYPDQWWTSTMDGHTGTSQSDTHALLKVVNSDGTFSDKLENDIAVYRPLISLSIDKFIEKYFNYGLLITHGVWDLIG